MHVLYINILVLSGQVTQGNSEVQLVNFKRDPAHEQTTKNPGQRTRCLRCVNYFHKVGLFVKRNTSTQYPYTRGNINYNFFGTYL
jgi:hypothetical protein